MATNEEPPSSDECGALNIKGLRLTETAIPESVNRDHARLLRKKLQHKQWREKPNLRLKEGKNKTSRREYKKDVVAPKLERKANAALNNQKHMMKVTRAVFSKRTSTSDDALVATGVEPHPGHGRGKSAANTDCVAAGLVSSEECPYEGLVLGSHKLVEFADIAKRGKPSHSLCRLCNTTLYLENGVLAHKNIDRSGSSGPPPTTVEAPPPAPPPAKLNIVRPPNPAVQPEMEEVEERDCGEPLAESGQVVGTGINIYSGSVSCNTELSECYKCMTYPGKHRQPIRQDDRPLPSRHIEMIDRSVHIVRARLYTFKFLSKKVFWYLALFLTILNNRRSFVYLWNHAGYLPVVEVPLVVRHPLLFEYLNATVGTPIRTAEKYLNETSDAYLRYAGHFWQKYEKYTVEPCLEAGQVCFPNGTCIQRQRGQCHGQFRYKDALIDAVNFSLNATMRDWMSLIPQYLRYEMIKLSVFSGWKSHCPAYLKDQVARLLDWWYYPADDWDLPVLKAKAWNVLANQLNALSDTIYWMYVRKAVVLAVSGCIWFVLGFRVVTYAYVPAWVTAVSVETSGQTEADRMANTRTIIRRSMSLALPYREAYELFEGTVLACQLIHSAHTPLRFWHRDFRSGPGPRGPF